MRSSPSQDAVRVKPSESAASPGPNRLGIPVRGLGPEALDAFLRSDRSPPDCMMLSDLDGLLTGVAIGPETIMPSEWLPLVWGGEDPVFDDGQQAQAVLGGIMSRYNQIVSQVADGTFQPILWTTPDGDLIATDWVEGFALAMSLRPKSWMPLARSRRHALLLLPILLLSSDDDDLSRLELEAEPEREFMQETAEILPACVLGIDEFWRERRTGPRAGLTTERIVGAARFSAKPGRNDPCPCGSGKKFKKCCAP